MVLNLKQSKALQYAILKNISDGMPYYAKQIGDFNTHPEVSSAINALITSEFVLGPSPDYAGNWRVDATNITEKGEKFLNDNSPWGKLLKSTKNAAALLTHLK
ncbi:hypothetical protein K9853_05070 [Lacticaseibacillus paracasei]|uniref:hypothetical protein n=1 Tax=Lacticaseibacillus paracasei TaxID=1597 RepID=UPI001EDF9A09|nr:hypothetical protein [Lacticaseibacillus paracasei]MCG4284083.1 hypothetical protein [Lacticaseibacillus paracasei]